MLRYLADEDFDNNILHGCLRRLPRLDVHRVQDAGLAGADDPDVLEWAAREGCVLLTHDVRTMKAFAYARVVQDLPMPGVFVVSQFLPVGLAIEELVTLAECNQEGEWEGRVIHLPL